LSRLRERSELSRGWVRGELPGERRMNPHPPSLRLGPSLSRKRARGFKSGLHVPTPRIRISDAGRTVQTQIHSQKTEKSYRTAEAYFGGPRLRRRLGGRAGWAAFGFSEGTRKPPPWRALMASSAAFIAGLSSAFSGNLIVAGGSLAGGALWPGAVSRGRARAAVRTDRSAGLPRPASCGCRRRHPPSGRPGNPGGRRGLSFQAV